MTTPYDLIGHVIRPPAEAGSVILQATIGCPHNRCAFCGTYRGVDFSVRDLDAFRAHVRSAAEAYPPDSSRVFLADGDVMRLATDALLARMEVVRDVFPRARRFGVYARSEGILAKSDDELAQLRGAGLRTVYLGLESGDDEVLAHISKGATSEEMTRAVQRAQAAGIRASVMALIGLAGRASSARHADATSRVLSEMAPRFTSLLSLRLVRGTELHAKAAAGEFDLLTDAEALTETRRLLEGLSCRTIFRCDHASNALPLAGNLPTDKARLLSDLDAAIKGAASLRPESFRGL